MALFHYEVFMPQAVVTPICDSEVKYTEHAKTAAENDRYGKINLPRKINFDNGHLIEAEAIKLAGGKLFCFKQVWRVSYDETRDLVVVVTHDGMVKTVWFNLKSDSHKTLKRHLYAKSINEA